MSYRPYYQAYKDDPYYQREYMHCYLKEGDEIFDFYESDGDEFFCFRSIKSPIKSIGNQKVEGNWYDLESVYGFGGYITNSQSSEFVEGALKKLQAKCLEENIVAHFMRFHPLNSFVNDFKDTLAFAAQNRKVVFVDAEDKDETELKQNYSSSLRRNINKAKRLGLEVRKLPPTDANRDQFIDLYYSTMERKSADELYFFSKEYFSKLFSFDKLRIYGTYYEDKLISMILALDSGHGEVYYHLGATHSDYYSFNPNPFVLNHIAEEVCHAGGKFLFLGGGNSNEDDDPLFKFKRKFATKHQDFYIGGSVFNEEKYGEFKTLAKELNENAPPMFLAYRFV